MKQTVLVTGGAGYIGSNVVLTLLARDYQVVIVDNLSTGNLSLIHPDAVFCNLNLADEDGLKSVFEKYAPHAVIHLAAFSSVGESAREPEKYFRNNVDAGVVLLNVMLENGCSKIIFSSSAAVYGEPMKTPIDEEHILQPLSVYGQTKMDFEIKLHEYHEQKGLQYLALRYFNAGGSSESGHFGELHSPETHLIPLIFQKTTSGEAVELFGDDYGTPDGTCVRDYVHVSDVAEAHVLGLDYLARHPESMILNLGSQCGYSVKEIIRLCEQVMATPIQVRVAQRRFGDPEILVASCEKAKKMLNWNPKRTILDIIQSAWKFHSSSRA